MTVPSTRLGIPLPLANETVSRQNFLAVYEAIDSGAARRDEPEALALDLLAQGFVLSGLVASKDGGVPTKVNVTQGVAYVAQAAGGLRRYAPPASSHLVSTPSALYYLDLQPDGAWSWGTSHSPETGYLAIDEVQTDAAGDITTVTDKRSTAPGQGPVNAHSVDGAHAGTGAGNALVLDSGGLVPLANLPGTLTGKDADTLDGQHASYYASAASVGALTRLLADAEAKDHAQVGTGVSVVTDTAAWSGQAVRCDATAGGAAASDAVLFPVSSLRWMEYVVAVRLKTNDATTANLAVLHFEQYVSGSWQSIVQKQIDGTLFTATGDYEVFYLRGHFSSGGQCRVRVHWNKATSTHILDIDAIVVVPVGATAAV